MLNALLGRFSRDIAIDLGTANTRVFVREKGLTMLEPSVVAINNRTSSIVAVGTTAKDMLGKTPPHITVTRPLTKGVISDFEVTEKLLKYFVDRVHEDTYTLVPRPRVVMLVPMEITEVERKAVEDAAKSAGAREVFLAEGAIAAAIGAGLPVQESVGSMVIDVGAGTTEIAVISLGGVVAWKSIPVAGDEMTRAIMQYARDVFNLLIGEKGAEEVKWRIGSALHDGPAMEMELRGRYLLSGLPRQFMVTDAQIRESLYRSISTIAEQVKATLEIAPPEIVADIFERGVVLTGGGALLRGFDRLLSREADVPVRLAEDPLTCSARGGGLLLETPDLLREMALPSTAIKR
jgi:rod shape-determining protein MreB